jgi:tRNA (adenine22-N1)-methyltransferase
MVGEMLPEGVVLADVGTDHAYLPAALILQGKIPAAIAADLRPGPLSRARATAQAYGLLDKIDFRLCDGLSGINPSETGAVSIAGMGGETIAAILQAAPWTREQDVPLVLQPMSSMPELRFWLTENGYKIVGEHLAREGETLYTALSVRAGKQERLTPAQCWVGRNSNDPLRGMWLEQWRSRVERALAGLAQSKQEQAAQRTAELNAVLAGIENMKKEWDAWQR